MLEKTGDARSGVLRIAALSLFAALTLVAAADPNTELLKASAAGQTHRVEMLLNAGANPDAKGNSGRTPLMLAAEHGHAETVRLLLSKGAKDGARDADGWTAYGLALFFPARGVSHASVEEVLKTLPRPVPVRLIVDAATNPEDLISSCFMSSRAELAEYVNSIHLDALVLSDFQIQAGASGGGLIQIVRADRHGIASQTQTVPAGAADAVLSLQVQPAASCSQNSGDSLSLSIDVRVFRVSDHALPRNLSGAAEPAAATPPAAGPLAAGPSQVSNRSEGRSGPVPLFRKSFGAGLTGLHARTVTNPSQYAAIYQGWVKDHAGAIYHDVVTALMKAAP